MVWGDREIEGEFSGGKKDGMEGEKGGSGSLSFDDGVPPVEDLAGGKSEKME